MSFELIEKELSEQKQMKNELEIQNANLKAKIEELNSQTKTIIN